MATMEMHANRNLRPRSLPDGTRRGVDNFFSFAHGSKPNWWSEDVPFAHDAFAVYENTPGSRRDAIVFTEHLLVVLYDHRSVDIPFDNIARLVPPPKEPLTSSLEVVLRSSHAARIPVNPPEAAFDLYRFLLRTYLRKLASHTMGL